MYSYIDRYYKSKNEEFKDVIKELCDTSEFRMKGTFVTFSPLSSEKEIKYEISELLSDKYEIEKQRFGFSDEYSGKYVVKLYEDLQKFHGLFTTKGIEITYKEILSIFKDVIDKEDRDYRVNEYFDVLKDEVVNKGSEREIIKKFIEYILETEEDVSFLKVRKLEEICARELPPLLQKFGFPCDEYNDDLKYVFKDVFEELKKEDQKLQAEDQKLQAEDFERHLDSSYDDENYGEEGDEDIDEGLLSEYLDEDIDDEEK